jgi:hypothetical protein
LLRNTTAKTRVIIAAACLALGIGAVFSLAAPARRSATPPPRVTALAETPDQVIARLKKDEAAVKSGHVTRLGVQQRGPLPEGARGPAAWEAARKAPIVGQRRDALRFAGTDWRRETSLADPAGAVQMRMVQGIAGAFRRVYEESGSGADAKKTASIGVTPALEAADYLFLGRGSTLLQGVKWSAARQEGAHLVLTGARGPMAVTLTLRAAPTLAVERLTSQETVVTPQGETHRGAELVAVYEADGLVPKTVEELMYSGAPLNDVRLSSFTAEEIELNIPVPQRELLVAIPRGAEVTDRRLDPPVTYTQGAKDLSVAEAEALRARTGPKTARVGLLAPNFTLTTLDGKTAKLSDFRGKTVLLTWFASW